jgi:hypothetical protein
MAGFCEKVMNQGSIKAGSLLASSEQSLRFQRRFCTMELNVMSVGYASHGQYRKYSLKNGFILREV